MDVWVGGPREGGGAQTALRIGIGLASAAAAAFHFAVVPEHLREYWLFGAFFVVSGVAQALWATLVSLRPTSAVYLAGLVGNATIIVIWILSRTLGVPVGPESGMPEPVGLLDSLSTVFELLIVAGAVALFRAGSRGRGASFDRAGR